MWDFTCEQWERIQDTADAAGISVTKYKYVATCVGCMIAGLGGLYYVMDYACGVWSNDAFGDRGWLAIALVIFTIWRPVVSIFCLHLLWWFVHSLPVHPDRNGSYGISRVV